MKAGNTASSLAAVDVQTAAAAQGNVSGDVGFGTPGSNDLTVHNYPPFNPDFNATGYVNYPTVTGHSEYQPTHIQIDTTTVPSLPEEPVFTPTPYVAPVFETASEEIHDFKEQVNFSFEEISNMFLDLNNRFADLDERLRIYNSKSSHKI